MSDLDITDSVLAELRSAADIVEVVSEHTRLKKAGRSWKGLCPFHNERTPSFTVDREKGLYHCFGCGAGGDVIHFVRQIDRLDFPEAVEALASRFGVSIPKRATRGPRDDRREKLLEALAAAHRFYAAELAKPGNRGAKYLKEREVPEELSARLGLGYAPDAWDSLSRLLSPAFPESLLVEAGLLVPRQEGKGAYDRFRDRLLFVVRDDRGRPVGFGGRALSPGAEPKYLNSSESPIFQKKRLLYGLSQAREAIRRRDRVIVVEGYFDHLAHICAGLEETVASMGTALTSEQAEKLRRLSPRVVICYDGDAAGRAATRGALVNLLSYGFAASVARMPEGEDPHDVLRREGPASLAARIEQAPDYLTWLLEDTKPDEPGISSAEKSHRILMVLEIVKAIADGILRHEECGRIARHVSVPLEVLWERVKPKAGRLGQENAERAAGTLGNAVVLSTPEIPASERRLLQILVSRGEYKSLILSTLKKDFLTHPEVRKLLAAIREADSASQAIDFHSQIAHLREEHDFSLLSRLALEESPEPTEQEVVRLLKRLEEQYLDRESVVLQAEISRADASGLSKEELDKLLAAKQELKRRSAEMKKSRKGKELGD